MVFEREEFSFFNGIEANEDKKELVVSTQQIEGLNAEDADCVFVFCKRCRNTHRWLECGKPVMN